MKRFGFALLLFVAAPALGAEPNARPDTVTIAAANRVLDALGYELLMARTVEKMSAPFEAETKRIVEEKTGKPANPEMLRRLAAVQQEFMRSFITDPKLRQATVLLYARHFTAKELDRVAKLLRDPVMQKWNEVSPTLMAEFMPLITGELNARRGEFQSQIVSILAEYLAADDQEKTTD